MPVAGQLGNTGTSAGTIAMVAAAVVLVGSALVLGARRRRQG
ncbi:LPXTG cell wall anchor domain-containing protein [Candidatus Neomicrothrix sp.]